MPTSTCAAATEALACAVEVIGDAAALERFVPEWRALWAAAGASPFLAPAWLLPWWRHVGRGTLAMVAVRDAERGALVGLAPLYVYADGAGGRRQLLPLGIATSDHHDLLARPGWEPRVAEAVAAHLAACAAQWDVLELPQLPAASPWSAVRWPAGWRTEVAVEDPHPVVALPALLPTGQAERLARARRRVRRAGDFAVEWADAASAPALLETLAALHARRWAERGEAGVLAGEGVLDAHREALPLLLADGLLRLLALRLDGRPIAVVYALADPPAAPARRWNSYIGGFEPDAATFSPGLLALGEAIEAAQAEGAVAFDFLRGAEPYKYRWGARDEARHALHVWPG